MMSNRRSAVHWLGVAVVSLGVVLILLGLASYVLGAPAFDENPTWIGAVCVLLGWGALATGRRRTGDDVG